VSVPAFTPQAAAALGGPAWLSARRQAAAELFADLPLPTPDEEVWRYSRIGKLDLDRFALVDANPLPTLEDFRADLGVVADRAGAAVTINGRLAGVEVDPALAAQGVRFGRVSDGGALGTVLSEAPDAFVAFNDAFAPDPLELHVPERVEVDRPFLVLHWIDKPGVAACPRLVVRVDQAGAARVVELVASTDVDALVIPVVELAAGRDANLGFLNVQSLGPQVWQLATQASAVDTQARLVASTAAFGGDYARQRTDCRLVGRGANGNLISLYFGDGDQMLDFRTFQDHQAPDCTSDLLFKGAVDGQSHSVYSGLIRVRPGAKGTNAFQTNRNIKLSEHAWAESVPNLEIENNDVRCSHASTVGPIDPEQRFYLESRGVPPREAEQLIVAGFFGEVIDRLAVPALAGQIEARIRAKIARGSVR
jgi:Fe-S cluster assembly protein SufD